MAQEIAIGGSGEYVAEWFSGSSGDVVFDSLNPIIIPAIPGKRIRLERFGGSSDGVTITCGSNVVIDNLNLRVDSNGVSGSFCVGVHAENQASESPSWKDVVSEIPYIQTINKGESIQIATSDLTDREAYYSYSYGE